MMTVEKWSIEKLCFFLAASIIDSTTNECDLLRLAYLFCNFTLPVSPHQLIPLLLEGSGQEWVNIERVVEAYQMGGDRHEVLARRRLDHGDDVRVERRVLSGAGEDYLAINQHSVMGYFNKFDT